MRPPSTRPCVTLTKGGSLRAALRQAHQAAAKWRSSALSVRSDSLQRLAHALSKSGDELALGVAREIGKPIRFARVEVSRAATMLQAIAKRLMTAPLDDAAGPALIRRRPHGVVAVITPWNNPIYLPLGKIAAAVAHGNSVVWKAAPQAAQSSHDLMEQLSAAGFPEGLINVVDGGRRAARELMSAPEVAAVSITGSSAAGAVASEICARRRIPLQAELGGNNAAVVAANADLASAARQIAAGAFEMAGQRCTANRRVIIDAARREEFLRLLVRETAALPWGDPLDETTRIGPLVTSCHRERVAQAVRRAEDYCEVVMRPHGSSSPHTTESDAAWYPPTVLACDDPTRDIVQEETFGPVLVVQTARDADHAIHLCNDVPQGLAAAIFTRSRKLADRFLDEARAGILKVNQSTADARVDVPFGGWKSSGIGPPEHGAFDVDFYTRPQTVYDAGPKLENPS